MSRLFVLGTPRVYTIEGVRRELLHGTGLRSWYDLNGDGYDDLVTTGAYHPSDGDKPVARQGWLALGTTSGWKAADYPSSTMLTVHSAEFVYGDFNEDGTTDFFLADLGWDHPSLPGGQNRLSLSAGAGRWTDSTSALPQVADFTHSAAEGDVNRDGHLDVIVGNGNLGASYLLLGDGRGNFVQDIVRLPIAAGQPYRELGVYTSLLADFDRDGWVDLALGSDRGGKGAQIFWSSNGSFANSTPTLLTPPSAFGDVWYVREMQPVDMNFDGLPDMVVAYLGDSSKGGWNLRLYLNRGDHTFEDRTLDLLTNPKTIAGAPTATGIVPSISSLRPLDLNGDGRTDFVVSFEFFPLDSTPRDFPLFLLQQPDGRYLPVTVGDLADNGVRMYPSGSYAQRGIAGTGEWVQLIFDASDSVKVNAVPIGFEPASSKWQAGTAAADTLVGGTGNDWFGGFGGNDVIDGGAGIDLARLTVARSASELARIAGGWTLNSGSDGIDTLKNIERLWFADGYLALDLDGNAGTVAKVLGALFGKTAVANKVFVGIGLSLLDAGTTPQQLVSMAVATNAFAQLAGGRSHAQFVELVFHNVVGSTPTAAQKAYYTGLLDGGQHTQASLALLASDLPLNAQAIDLVGLANFGLPYDPYTLA